MGKQWILPVGAGRDSHLLCKPPVIVSGRSQLASEEQSIARAHRMGQVRPVDVHRLLCEDSVDQRVLELLGDKRAAFDEYAADALLRRIDQALHA